jgi:hypothetical protein
MTGRHVPYPGEAPFQDAVRPDAPHVPTGDGGDTRDVVYCNAPNRGTGDGAPLAAEAAGEAEAIQPGQRARDASCAGARFLYQAPSWTLGGVLSQTMTGNQWTTFQQRFVEGWAEHVERHAYDLFWAENEPAFHAHDYGGNIKIEVSAGVATLTPETRVRPDEEGDSDGEGGAAGDADPEVEPDGEGDADPLFVQDGVDDQRPSNPRTPDDWPLHLGSTDDLYSDGLRQLAVALEKYDLPHISGFSYSRLQNRLHLSSGHKVPTAPL